MTSELKQLTKVCGTHYVMFSEWMSLVFLIVLRHESCTPVMRAG